MLYEVITERGIGNGISLIIAASIMTRVPGAFWDIVRLIKTDEITVFGVTVLLLFLAAIIGAIVFVERSVITSYSIHYTKLYDCC